MVNRGYKPTYCITRGSHIVWCSQLTWFRAVSVISGSITAVIRVVATFLGYLMRSITIHIHTFLSHTLIIYPIYIDTPITSPLYPIYIHIVDGYTSYNIFPMSVPLAFTRFPWAGATSPDAWHRHGSRRRAWGAMGKPAKNIVRHTVTILYIVL